MPPFLPNSPRRRWSPSQWNLVRAGSAIGATLALGACADDVVGSEDETSDSSGDSIGELDGWNDETYGDSSTDYSDDYSDSWDYGDYGDYGDHDDHGDYSDDYWGPECYSDADCGPGMQCIEYYCEPLSQCGDSSECAFDEFCDDEGSCVGVDLPAQCPEQPFHEIPLPPEAAGVVVALSFVDLDGDGAQELVLLRDDAIVVVDGDQVTTVDHAGIGLDGIAATDVDEDGLLDLIATSSTKLNARVFFADGLGGFTDSGVGPMMRLDHVRGIDWAVGGPGELLARDQAHEAVVLSSVAQLMPQVEALELGAVDALGVADFNGDLMPDFVALQSCSPLLSFQGGDLVGLDALGPPGTCALGIGDVDWDLVPDLAVVRADAKLSVVNVYANNLESAVVVGLYGSYSAIQPTSYGNRPYALLGQTGAELDYVWRNDNRSWCRVTLPAPPISSFAVGDADFSGVDEIATLDPSGTAQLWIYQ